MISLWWQDFVAEFPCSDMVWQEIDMSHCGSGVVPTKPLTQESAEQTWLTKEEADLSDDYVSNFSHSTKSQWQNSSCRISVKETVQALRKSRNYSPQPAFPTKNTSAFLTEISKSDKGEASTLPITSPRTGCEDHYRQLLLLYHWH